MIRFLPILLTFLTLSCGLDDVPLIHPIPQSHIRQDMNNRSVVSIPTDNADTTFSHFVIYYKIFVSNTDQPSTASSAAYSAINPILASDHNAVSPHIDSTTSVNVNMESFFSGRDYHQLHVQGPDMQAINISTILSSSVLGSTIEFDFPSRTIPNVTIDSTVYTLWRSNGNGQFDPRPNRLFINSDDLWTPGNINAEINRDVVNLQGIGANDRRYVYVAMYIVGAGINVATYSFIYSTPSLIHVFQLPDRW